MIKLKAQNLKRKTMLCHSERLVKNLPPQSNDLTWKIASSLRDLAMTILFLLYTLPFTLYPSPAYAEVDIGSKFGFGDIKSLGEGTGKLVTPVFSLAMAAVIIYFLIGAFKYLTSGGDKEAVAGARQMITHAMIGFIILIFAFFILQFLLSSLLGITGLRLF